MICLDYLPVKLLCLDYKVVNSRQYINSTQHKNKENIAFSENKNRKELHRHNIKATGEQSINDMSSLVDDAILKANRSSIV